MSFDKVDWECEEPERGETTPEDPVLDDTSAPGTVHKPILSFNANHIPLVVVNISMKRGKSISAG